MAFGNGDTVPGDGQAIGTKPTTTTKDQRGNVPSLITFSSRNHGRRVYTRCVYARARVTATTRTCTRVYIRTRVYTHIHTHMHVSHGSRRPLAKVQISRQIKSFSPAILLARVPPTFSLESIGGSAARPAVLVSSETGRPAKSSAHVRDPATSRGDPPSRARR